MACMSEHTGLISPYQLLIIAACTNTGGQMKGSHPRPADRCPFVLSHSISQVTSFMQLGMLWGTRIYASPFRLCWPPTVCSMMGSRIGFNVPCQNEHHCINKWGLVGRVSWMSCEQGVRVPQKSKLGQVSSICTQEMRWGVWHSISDSSPMVYKWGG